MALLRKTSMLSSVSKLYQVFMRLIALCCTLLLAFTGPAFSKQLDLVVGWDKPPYVMAKEDSGFEVELARAIFADLGHHVNVMYVPFGRTARMVESGAADIGLTLNPKHNISPELLTDCYVIYQNVAVSLSDRKLAINEIPDLAGKSVIAFQTAKAVLGDTFNATLASQQNYLEFAEQERQVNMLLLGSVDVAILDRNIFSYLKSKLPEERQKATQFHELFPVSSYSAAIADPILRSQFNQTLRQFIRDGRYQAMLDEFGLENLFDRLPAKFTRIYAE